MPSYFVAHVYHWGDVHLVNFGKQRAENISCTASALKNHIPFTFHQDTPVILPDMLESVWAAVNRITKNGVVLGEQQRISVLEALKAVTITPPISISRRTARVHWRPESWQIWLF